MLLEYDEFGPQVLAHELIGMEWYQWDTHGYEEEDHEYNIKIVVYKGMDLDTVKKTYPVIKDKRDYRYVECRKAIRFLEKTIKFCKEGIAADDSLKGADEGTVRTLRATLSKIRRAFEENDGT